MADLFNNPSDLVAPNAGLNMGTSGSLREQPYASDELWQSHDAHFQQHHASRPHARADRSYEHYRPAYRYGHDAAHAHRDREWDDVESDLSRDWHARHAAGGDDRSTWEEMKGAVRDGWDRVRGR